MSARPVLLAAVVVAVVTLYLARYAAGSPPVVLAVATDAVLPIAAFAWLLTRRTRRCEVRRYY